LGDARPVVRRLRRLPRSHGRGLAPKLIPRLT
jgi:hypothetical protein